MFDNVADPRIVARELLEQFEAEEKKNKVQSSKSYKEYLEQVTLKEQADAVSFISEAEDNFAKRQMKRENFSVTLKENLLQECFNIVFESIMKKERATHHEVALGRSMINKFIKEEGVNNLLTRFENRNLVLSEFARFTDKYHYAVMEALGKVATEDPDNDTCYVLDKEIAQKFIDDVKDLVPERTIDIIRDRVEDAIQSFIDQNTNNKQAIKDIYLKAKVATAKSDVSDDVKQEVALEAKIATNAMYEKPVNIFTYMVGAVREATMKVDALKEQYCGSDNKPDYKRICNDVGVMYTVLEMMNTLNVIDVNEQYLLKVMNDLKEF